MPSDDMERAAGAYAKDMRKLRQSAIDDMDRARELLGFGDTGGGGRFALPRDQGHAQLVHDGRDSARLRDMRLMVRGGGAR